MPSYKLTYFDVRGRGELCRYAFHATGRDFEDNRVGGETWKEMKESKSCLTHEYFWIKSCLTH